jgi:hypothetical protein
MELGILELGILIGKYHFLDHHLVWRPWYCLDLQDHLIIAQIVEGEFRPDTILALNLRCPIEQGL